jgi:hypothetical protein
MVLTPHPKTEPRLAAQRFGQMSGRREKCFEETEFCFVRNPLTIRGGRPCSGPARSHVSALEAIGGDGLRAALRKPLKTPQMEHWFASSSP